MKRKYDLQSLAVSHIISKIGYGWKKQENMEAELERVGNNDGVVWKDS